MIIPLVLVAASFLSTNQAQLPNNGIVGGKIYDPVSEARWKKANEVRNVVARFHNDGYHNLADTYLKTVRREDPTMELHLLEESAVCDIFVGRYAEARRKIMQVLEGMKGGHTRNHWFKLALIDSLENEAVRSRLNYAKGLVQSEVELSHFDEPYPSSQTRSDSKSLAVISCLALSRGPAPSIAYLELAMRLDPANLAVGENLLARYKVQKRTEDVLRVATIMVKNLPPGPDRNRFEQELARKK